MESILISSAPVESVKLKNFPAKEGVDEALKRMPVVPVALTWKRAERSKDAVVVAPTTNDLYGEEVAERKSPEAMSSKVLPKPAPPEPHTVPVLERSPVVSNWAQPVTPPRLEKLGIPLALILKTEAVEVAKVEADDVAR